MQAGKNLKTYSEKTAYFRVRDLISSITVTLVDIFVFLYK